MKNKIRFFLLISLAFIFSPAAQAQEMAPHCQRQNSGPEIQRFPDGTIIPRPNVLSCRQRPAEIEQKMRDPAGPNSTSRIQFDAALASLKQSMINQVSSNSQPPARDYILNRLESLRIEFGGERCGELPMNAAYQQVSNTLQVCPLLTHMPAEATLALLAHELGHLADPCNFPDVFKFSGEIAGSGEISEALLSPPLRRCLGTQSPTELNEFISWANGPSRRLNREFAIYPGESQRRGMVGRLVTCGLATAPTVPAPTTYEHHPYLSAISCVTRTYPRPEDLFVSPKPKAAPVFTTPEPITANTRVGGAQACATDRSPTVSQTKEAVADHIGASLLNFHLNRVGESIPENRRALLPYWFESIDCELGNRAEELYLRSSERLNIYTSAMQSMGVPLANPSSPVRCPVITETSSTTPALQPRRRIHRRSAK